MGEQNKVDYEAQIVALNAAAMNGAAATLTTDAILVRGNEFLRVEYFLVLDGSGLAATNTVMFSFWGSQDNGATFRPMRKIASDDAVTAFAPVHTISAAEITALLAEGDLGAIHVVGLTHVKIVASNPAGAPDGDNKLTIKVRACRE